MAHGAAGSSDRPERQAADSAGVPWGGRSLPRGGFDGDDGRPDPAVLAALAAARRPGANAGANVGAADQQVVAALSASRVLVPVVAVLGAGVETEHGMADQQADMALVTLTAPDGRRALPVFSGLASLACWDGTARPVPVEFRRAAVSAVAERCDVLVLDPAGPLPYLLGRPALWAVAQGRPWVPAVRDPQVRAALGAALEPLAQVVGWRCEPAVDAELRLVVEVVAGLSRPALQVVGEQVQRVLQECDVVRERVEGVQVALVSG